MKLKFTVIGLPGKLPVSLALRTFWPPRSASSSGATVWPYFFFVAAIQFLIAATPLVGLAFVVHGRIRREALRHRLGRAGICNLNVTRNRVG